ncbi:MAG TPA: hypothetical protein VKA08_05045 [Balneolales bacterium]|nr:hypothetical protein [Balneolales bacterium]
MAATSELVQEQHAYEVLSGGTMLEAIGGIAAIALTILSLAGLMPVLLTSIAVIAIGAALFMEGTSIAAEYRDLLASTSNNQLSAEELGSGISIEFVAGIGAIALGILSLVGVATFTLLPISAIVLGAGVLLSSGTKSRLNSTKIRMADVSNTANAIARDIASTSIAGELFIGVGAMTLGILALIGLSPMMLTIIGILGVGTSSAMSGSALSGRFWGLTHE